MKDAKDVEVPEGRVLARRLGGDVFLPQYRKRVKRGEYFHISEREAGISKDAEGNVVQGKGRSDWRVVEAPPPAAEAEAAPPSGPTMPRPVANDPDPAGVPGGMPSATTPAPTRPTTPPPAGG